MATAACLWLASHAPWWAAGMAAAAFGLLNFMPFALAHEAIHGVAAGTPRRNAALGTVASWLFPTSFLMQRAAHLGHHARNRTDVELFDCVQPGQRRWVRNLVLYGGNLLGLYWLLIPLTNLLYLLAPPLYRSAWFVHRVAPALGAGPFVRDLAALSPRRVWWEIALAFGYQAALWWLLDLNWRGWLLAHGCFALHWSALQYVGHAWSARDVRHGAWDLRVSRWAGALALNFHCHLAHHRHPRVPWPALPALACRDGQPTFWQIYCRLWRYGVQPAPPLGAPARWTLPSIHP